MLGSPPQEHVRDNPGCGKGKGDDCEDYQWDEHATAFRENMSV